MIDAKKKRIPTNRISSSRHDPCWERCKSLFFVPSILLNLYFLLLYYWYFSSIHQEHLKSVQHSFLHDFVSGGSSSKSTAQQSEHRRRKPQPLPPINTVLDQYGNITGNVSHLLDLSTIGFGKCGTSTIMSWLGQHPEIQIPQYEIWDLSDSRPDLLVQKIYKEMKDPNKLRGIKCPGDILMW